MTARNSHEITPKSAERLLDGQGGPAPLARLLDDAAAPGRPHEFRGEDAAVAAFEVHHARHPVARGSAARSPGGRMPLARILVLAAALCGGGGVALAAATGAFSGSPAPAPSAARVSPGASSVFRPSAHATGGPVRARGPVMPSVPSQRGSSPQAADPAALCRDLAAQAQGLASSAVAGALGEARYAPLTETAGGALGVPDYCALLLRLPALPQPAGLARVPASVLASALPGLPAGTLSEILPGLPAPVLSQVLTGLPAGPLGEVLGKLPTSAESAILTRLPAATVSRIQAKLPLRKLPGAGTGLPTTKPSPLPSRLPVG